MKPEVSVILPYYEGQRWLKRAIQCVQAQKRVSWELIVVDDGSKQSPVSIINSLNDKNIRLISIAHAGKGAALNTGIKAARADIICFLDQDDVMLPGRLQLQLDAFTRKPHSEVVYSDYQRISENGELIDQFISYQASNQECLRKLARDISLLSMQTIMVRKETIFNIGGFCSDPNLTGLDDAEFLFRLFISDPVLTYQPGFVQQWIEHGVNYSKSAQFQENRLILINYLSVLSRKHPILQKELPYIRFRIYYMRGLYYLENRTAKRAWCEFLRAIRLRPLNWNCDDLLIKSLVYQLVY
jgi:glycosyltransferase involved in cell wall biosynthesis